MSQNHANIDDIAFTARYTENFDLPKIKHDFAFSTSPILKEWRPKYIERKYPYPFCWQNIYSNNIITPQKFFTQIQDQRLDRAKSFIQQKNYQSAKSVLIPLVEKERQLNKITINLLSCISIEENHWEQTASYIKLFKQSQEYPLFSDGYYFELLVAYLQDDQTEFDQILQQWQNEKKVYPYTFKIKFLEILQLLKTKKENSALKQAQQLQQDYPYSIYNDRIAQIIGDITFSKQEYAQSIESYQNALKLNHFAFDQIETQIKIAWAQYFKSEIDEAKKTLNVIKLNKINKNEIELLFSLIAIKDNQLKAFTQHFLKIENQSEYKTIAAVAVSQSPLYLKLDKITREVIFNLDYMHQQDQLLIHLFEGNRLYSTNQFKEAEKRYLNALTYNLTPKLYQQLIFNISLVSMQLNDYKKAEENLKSLVYDENHEMALYHLYYVYYLQSNSKAIQNLSQEFQPNFEKKHLQEIEIIIALSFLMENEIDIALDQLRQSWKKHHNERALEVYAEIAYKSNRLETLSELAIQLKKQPLGFKQYYIRSLIDQKKYDEAKKYLRTFKTQDELNARLLYIEIWQAQKEFNKIIKNASRWLQTEKNPNKRFTYYLQIGDAYYNLQNYEKHLELNQNALKIAKNQDQKNQVYSNKILNYRVTLSDNQFIVQVQKLPQDEFQEQTAFQYSDLLSTAYINENQQKKAIREYYNYINKFNDNENYFKRNLLDIYSQKEYNRCFKIGKKSWIDENTDDQTFRILTTAECALNIRELNWIFKELNQFTSDQEKEIMLKNMILAQAYINDQQYELAKTQIALIDQLKLDPSMINRFNHIQAQLSAHEGNWEEAIKSISNVSQFGAEKNALSIYKLQAEGFAKTGDYKSAVRSLTRILYNKGLDEQDKTAVRLLMIEYLLKSSDKISAEKVLEKIDKKKLNEEQKKYYETVQAQLQ